MTRANHGARPGPQSPNDGHLALFRTATLGLALVIAWLAFRPAATVDAGLPWDKANHALAFVALTVLAGRGWPGLRRSLLVLAMLMAGVGIELVQGLPQIGRDADAGDVVADAVGIALGLAVSVWWRGRRASVRG